MKNHINKHIILENGLVDSIKRNPGKYALGAGLGGLLAYSYFNQPYQQDQTNQTNQPDQQTNNQNNQNNDSSDIPWKSLGVAGAAALAYKHRAGVATGLKTAVNVSKDAYDASKGIYNVAKAASPGIKKAYIDGKNELLGKKESTVPLPPNFNNQSSTAPAANPVKKTRTKKTKANTVTPAITPIQSTSPSNTRRRHTGRSAGGR